MFYTLSIIKEINNANYKEYVDDKQKRNWGMKIHSIPKQFLIPLNLKR